MGLGSVVTEMETREIRAITSSIPQVNLQSIPLEAHTAGLAEVLKIGEIPLLGILPLDRSSRR